jgi:hypothetical protein
MTTRKKQCFVIMPFSRTKKIHPKQYWDTHFESFLKPLIDSCADVEAHRSTPLRVDILKQIINDLAFSDIVVADITDSNPNVYWELGVRLSFRHGTITIAEEDSEIPFDLKTKGCLFYDKDPTNRGDFEKSFKEAICDCLSNPNRPDSIVLETITGRGSIYSVIHHQEILNRLDGLIAENQFNRALFKEACNQALRNDNRRLSSLRINYQLIITQLGTSAVGLLLAEHYIEGHENFYELAQSILAYIGTINERLSVWTSNSDIGKWFSKHAFEQPDVLVEFEKQILEIKQQMLSQC